MRAWRDSVAEETVDLRGILCEIIEALYPFAEADRLQYLAKSPALVIRRSDDLEAALYCLGMQAVELMNRHPDRPAATYFNARKRGDWALIEIVTLIPGEANLIWPCSHASDRSLDDARQTIENSGGRIVIQQETCKRGLGILFFVDLPLVLQQDWARS